MKRVEAGILSRPITSNNGFRQGYVLSLELFNFALEKIIKSAHNNAIGIVYNKSVQIIVYVDDLDV